MKILICSHYQTGDTENVARAMKEDLAGQDVTISSASLINPTLTK